MVSEMVRADTLAGLSMFVVTCFSPVSAIRDGGSQPRFARFYERFAELETG